MDDNERRAKYTAWFSTIVHDKTLPVSRKLKLLNSAWGMDAQKALASIVTTSDYLRLLDAEDELIEANHDTITDTLAHLVENARHMQLLFELMHDTLTQLADASAD